MNEKKKKNKNENDKKKKECILLCVFVVCLFVCVEENLKRSMMSDTHTPTQVTSTGEFCACQQVCFNPFAFNRSTAGVHHTLSRSPHQDPPVSAPAFGDTKDE